MQNKTIQNKWEWRFIGWMKWVKAILFGLYVFFILTSDLTHWEANSTCFYFYLFCLYSFGLITFALHNFLFFCFGIFSNGNFSNHFSFNAPFDRQTKCELRCKIYRQTHIHTANSCEQQHFLFTSLFVLFSSLGNQVKCELQFVYYCFGVWYCCFSLFIFCFCFFHMTTHLGCTSPTPIFRLHSLLWCKHN